MKPFYSEIERKQALQKEASEWIGTPFVPNGMSKGFGVSCQTLAGMIYKNTGFLPTDFKIPTGPMNWHHSESLFDKFVATLSMKFELVEDINTFQVGDFLGFKMGEIIHHCGVVIMGDVFIHVFEKLRMKTMMSSLRDPTYRSRLSKVWRPIE
jgi:cell wall-associated NlpC family hydrolase